MHCSQERAHSVNYANYFHLKGSSEDNNKLVRHATISRLSRGKTPLASSRPTNWIKFVRVLKNTEMYFIDICEQNFFHFCRRTWGKKENRYIYHLKKIWKEKAHRGLITGHCGFPIGMKRKLDRAEVWRRQFEQSLCIQTELVHATHRKGSPMRFHICLKCRQSWTCLELLRLYPILAIRNTSHSVDAQNDRHLVVTHNKLSALLDTPWV